MKNNFRIGITDDTTIMRCRLIVKLVEMCGATPVLIPTFLKKKSLEEHFKIVDEILEGCDALIFPGNKRDVHPSLYGQDYIHPQTRKRLPLNKSNVRQATEVRMLKYALKRQDMPVLGICGGMQLINVVLGGDLVQHLPDDKRTDNSKSENYHYDDNLKTFSTKILEKYENDFELIVRGKKDNIFTGTHRMKVMDDSLLAAIYKKSNPNINLENIKELSIHHQGCFEENLSDQLKISAISPDGVIEAAEHKNYPKMFLLTQFHPECDASNVSILIIEQLINDLKKK